MNKEIEHFGLPKPNELNLFGGNKGQSRENSNIKYNSKGEEVPVWVQVNENGKVTINTGLLADYLINNIPAIYVASQLYIYENGVYRKSLEDEDLTIVRELIPSQYCTMYRIKDAAAQWRTDRKVKIDSAIINNYPNLLNLKNCIYDIKSDKLIKHTTEFKSTIQINANYNPEAKGETFIKFINEAIPNKRNQMIAQEILGYCLTTFTDAKKFFILLGRKDTGKSTFLRLLENLIPKDNVSHVELQSINKEYNTAQLFEEIA